MIDTTLNRRHFLLGTAGALLAAQASASPRSKATKAPTAPVRSTTPLALMPVQQVQTDTLDIGYHETGPADGHPVILLHGFPYDIHSYADVAPLLAKQGYRVLVPYLRGHGATRFLDAATPRAGQQAAIGQDLIDFMDALHIPEAVLAGYDWGGRAACVVAALKPSRVVGLVSVNSYLIQDIAKAALPAPPKVEAGFWYQFYFLTERGRAGLSANRDDIAASCGKGTRRAGTSTAPPSCAAHRPSPIRITSTSYCTPTATASATPTATRNTPRRKRNWRRSQSSESRPSHWTA